jgi:hypothetical protein
MSGYRTGAITAVYTDAKGSVRVNVATGGPDGTPGVPVFAAGPDQPAIGDNAVIVEVDTGSWICLGWAQTTPVAAPAPVAITVQDTAPSGALFSQISTVWAQKFVLGQPQIVLVRSSVPTPPSGGTIVQQATKTASYGDLYGWRTDSFRVYQGNYGYGSHTGLWFYPSLTAALSGKTITRVRMDLYRADSGGSAGPVQLHLYTHNYAAQPGGAPTITAGPNDPPAAALGWNDSATVDLPVSFGNALQAGTAAGIAISATSSDDYSILLGADEQPLSGRLTLDYA